MTDSLPEWAVDVFKVDGSLRDIYVRAVTTLDWQMVTDAARATYPWTFTLDGVEQSFPERIEAVFEAGQRAAVTLALDVAGIDVRCHFFTTDEIEFDLAPEDVDEESRVASVIELMRNLAGWSGRTVELTEESAPELALLRATSLGTVHYVGSAPHRAV